MLERHNIVDIYIKTTKSEAAAKEEKEAVK